MPALPVEVLEHIQRAKLLAAHFLPKLTTLQEIELDQGLRPLENDWRL